MAVRIRRRSAGADRVEREPRRRRRKAPWWELPALVVAAVLLAAGLKTFVVQPFSIPSGSMETTLHGCKGCSGDRIVVDKLTFDARDPHPGDIVVFRRPAAWPPDPEYVPSTSDNPVLAALQTAGRFVGVVPPDEEDLVKRVIAVGGQTVEGTADGTVRVSNGGADGPWRTLDERSFVDDDGAPAGSTVQQPFGPVTVPAGRLWVMGDHRTNSADSRYHCAADVSTLLSPGTTCDPTTSTVAVDDVVGKVRAIAWPASRWTTFGVPDTFDARHDPLP